MITEALIGIGIFLLLWTFFNPTHDENYKEIVAADRRQNDSSVEAMIIAFAAVAVAFFFWGAP